MPSKDTQFKPGQSGNPGGRPKGSVSLMRRVQLILESGVDPEEYPCQDNYDRLARSLLMAGLGPWDVDRDGKRFRRAPDPKVAQDLLNRLDGKAPDTIKHEGDGLRIELKERKRDE